MTNFAEIKCPFCGRRKAVRPQADSYFCTRCFKHFDDDPDEGGDYSDRNPAARLEREERKKKR